MENVIRILISLILLSVALYLVVKYNDSRNEESLFNYNRFLKPICQKLTNHRYRRVLGCNQSFIDNGYKNPSKHDFYYKCKLCGYVYFNHTPTKQEIEEIKEDE